MDWSRYDYQKHYLTPLRSSPPPMLPLRSRPAPARNRRRIPREVRERSRREREEREEADRFDQAVAKRKWVYKHDLYAKHIASNSFTRYRPYPTPTHFAANPELISRTTIFLRRELLVWPDLDVEFLTTFVISLMKAIDIRSESAVKLLAEFLDMDAPYVEGRRHINAEHFAHEVYSYVRSPYRDLFVYDSVVQYENPRASPPPQERRNESRSRWRQSSPSRSRSRSPYSSRPRRSSSRSRDRRGGRGSGSRSPSWSPSGRRYLPERDELEVGRSSQKKRERKDTSRDRRGNGSRVVERDVSMERHKNHDRTDEPYVIKGKGKGKQRTDDDRDYHGRRQPHPETTDLASEDFGRPGSSRSLGESRSMAVDREVEADHYDRGFSEMDGKPDDTSNGMVTGNSESDAISRTIHVDSTSKGDTRGSRSAPKMRNRNLLQSVQAHLASSSWTHQSATSKPATFRPQPFSHTPQPPLSVDASVGSEKPSLLSRLSDVYTGVGSPEHHDVNTTPGQTTPETIHSENETLMEINEKLESKSRPPSNLLSSTLSPSTSSMVAIDTSTSSKPDEGTFTHAHPTQYPEELRSTPLTSQDKDSIVRKQAHIQRTYTVPDRKHNTLPADPDAGSERSKTTSDISLGYSNGLVTDTGMPDSRIKLLQRLEKEKRKIQDGHDGHDGHDDSNGAEIASSVTNAVHDTLPTGDPKEMEARLRMRAHLRARLASEKRSSMASSGSNT
ncbi:hypothetical protein VNI00_013961 [Paramarasmius palmivorus]|uniref:RING-type E3 ubiquitin transferase n=1 Tax=Paramarasmius palmivorus TaxID=297713 RepID=A0AAW0BVD3_9AGAR